MSVGYFSRFFFKKMLLWSGKNRKFSMRWTCRRDRSSIMIIFATGLYKRMPVSASKLWSWSGDPCGSLRKDSKTWLMADNSLVSDDVCYPNAHMSFTLCGERTKFPFGNTQFYYTYLLAILETHEVIDAAWPRHPLYSQMRSWIMFPLPCRPNFWEISSCCVDRKRSDVYI